MVKSEYLIFNELTQKYELDPEQKVRDDVEKNRWRLNGATILRDWRLYLMLVPMILVFLFWRYFPMYELLGCFKDPDSGVTVAEQSYAGFFNFWKVMFSSSTQTQMFWKAFRNTFLLSFYGLLFGFPMPIILALFFNEIKSNGLRSVYQVLTYLPKFMSTVVMTSLVTMLLKQNDLVSGSGIISVFLNKLGWISDSTMEKGLLNDPKYFRAIYQISGIWESSGYDSIVYFAAVIAVSPTLYEAAQIDGASKMQQMVNVVIPCILSTVVIMLINRIGSLLSIGYEKVILLYNTNTWVTADVVSTLSYRWGILGEGGNTAMGSAAEMLNNITGMILVIGANTIARKASNVSLY